MSNTSNLLLGFLHQDGLQLVASLVQALDLVFQLCSHVYSGDLPSGTCLDA